MDDIQMIGSISAVERIEALKRNAAVCSRLAGKASTKQDQDRWINLAKFWLSRAERAEGEASGASEAAVV